jgi:hypothetical protein
MMTERDGCVRGDRILWPGELRQAKFGRAEFATLPRPPIMVVLDRIRKNYNIGASFRLCDAFLVERLIIGRCRAAKAQACSSGATACRRRSENLAYARPLWVEACCAKSIPCRRSPHPSCLSPRAGMNSRILRRSLRADLERPQRCSLWPRWPAPTRRRYPRTTARQRNRGSAMQEKTSMAGRPTDDQGHR